MTAVSLDSAYERVQAAIAELTGDMVDFTRELVRIPTVNPPGEHYQDCAALLERRYRALGYETRLVLGEGMPEHSQRYPRVNVVARRPGPGKTLHFNGHFDVVPAGDGWTVPPFAGTVNYGRIYGRGVTDQKAGLAASLYAVEALERAGIELNGVVEQSATVDEESGGFAGVALLCREGLIQRGRTDFVIITEPLGHDRICLGHRGVHWFEVIAHGRTAHGSMPSLGINAADVMAELITRVNRELKPLLAERHTSMPVEPASARQPSINLNGLIAGQTTEQLQTPCVPDLCRAVFDRRFIPEETIEEVRAEIASLIESHNRRSPGHLEVRDLMTVLPVQTSADCSVVRALERAIERVTGRRAALIASPGTYDQKHVQRTGNVEECVAYGPGILELAHQPDEYVEIQHLVSSTVVLALTAMELLGWKMK